MDAPKPASSNLNVLLAACALGLWVLGSGVLVRDVWRTHQQSSGVPEAVTLANAALKQVEDPAKGWFPFSRDPVFSWESDEQGWKLEDGGLAAAALPNAVPSKDTVPAQLISNPALPAGNKQAPLRVADTTASNGRCALAVPVSFPAPVTIIRDNSLNDGYRLQGVRFVAYDVYVPIECRGYVGCLLFLKDKDGLWYQARSRAALLPGRWTTVTADIRGDSPDVTPLGHLGQWDDNQATRVRAVGITFYGDREYTGEILIDNLRAWMRPQRFLSMVNQLGNNAGSAPIAPERIAKLQELSQLAQQFKAEPIKVVNLRTEPAAAGSVPVVKQYETLTLRFELNREIENPFDPEKSDVTCKVTTPAGEVLQHVGFWYQDYDRGDRFAGDELLPIGRPEWRVRITPRVVGEYKYHLKVNLKGEVLELPVRTFKCEAGSSKGFVRVSPTDKRFFELDNGEFFYPIGHNLHTPVDLRCWNEIFKKEAPAGRGLPMYVDFFQKMQQNGENTAEIWMASWWVGIEWTSKWRDYYGAGRYSLQNAWKLDYLLELARKHDIRAHLVLDNHGKFSAWCDWEWDLNPYNSACDPGGVVVSAAEFFTNEMARKWHRNRLRYISARWGCDPTVLGWELVSEYDLVGGKHRRDSAARGNFHRSPTLQAWAKEMITHLRQCDVYKHPVTNHYATDFNWIDAELARSDFFDYVVTDAYRGDLNYSGAAMRMQHWSNAVLKGSGNQKPFWITEYGGDFNAAHPNALHADVHCGLWATWMTDGCGTPLFWWYDFIDVNNLYPYYRAFANFIKGEDRRGLQGTMNNLVLTGGATAGVAGTTYVWKTGGYAWAYNVSAMQMMPAPSSRPSHADVQAAISGLDPGKYRVEYWDCYEGVAVQTEHKDVAAGQPLALKFPPFINNMAVKFKKE